MISRKDLMKSVFNKNNIVKIIDVAIPVDLAKSEPIYDIPELSGDMLYFEAMRLGIDPSTLPAEILKEAVIAEMFKKQNKQAPSDAGKALTGDSANG